MLKSPGRGDTGPGGLRSAVLRHAAIVHGGGWFRGVQKLCSNLVYKGVPKVPRLGEGGVRGLLVQVKFLRTT